MDESQFWPHLEGRICGEFAGMPEKRLRYFWCDGFLPETYDLEGVSPRITGRCWICNGSLQAEWDFALLLPHAVSSREEIDWGSLLPARNATCWMCFDEERRYLEMEPAIAVPDLR